MIQYESFGMTDFYICSSCVLWPSYNRGRVWNSTRSWMLLCVVCAWFESFMLLRSDPGRISYGECRYRLAGRSDRAPKPCARVRLARRLYTIGLAIFFCIWNDCRLVQGTFSSSCDPCWTPPSVPVIIEIQDGAWNSKCSGRRPTVASCR